jgi:xanthine dehydrogenase accessory factor
VRRKFAMLAARLVQDGLSAESLPRVKVPAGLNIHAIPPEEIARPILAEITFQHRSGGRKSPAT